MRRCRGGTLQPDRRYLLQQYGMVDTARTVVGVGTHAWILLMEGLDGGDSIFLQARGRRPPWRGYEDVAELGGRLAHPGGDPAQHHLAVLPALDVGGVVAAGGDHRLDRVRGPAGPGEGRWHAQPADREGLSQAFTQGRGGAGLGAVQLPRQGFQVGLGDQRIRVAVGGPHPLRHHRGQRPLGRSDEPARDPDLEVPVASWAMWLPTGSSPAW